MSEIPHVYAEQTTQQSTTSTSYVAALTVDDGDLTNGDKYYVQVTADFGNEGATKRTYVRAKHGTSVAARSSNLRIPEDSGDDKKHIYRWQGVITAASGKDFVVEHKTSSGGTSYLDNICVLFISLEGLTEGDDTTAGDYRFETQSSTYTSLGYYTDHANATVKHSGSGDEDWLVLGHGYIKWPFDPDFSFWIALSDGTSERPVYSRVWDNWNDDFQVLLERIYTISGDTDFAVIAQEDADYPSVIESSIFCLNLDVFAAHSKSHSFSSSFGGDGDIVAHGTDAAFADSSEDYEVATVDHAAGTAGPHWILGGISNMSASATHSCYFRLRHGTDTVLPDGATGGEHEYERQTSTGSDRVSLSRSLVYDVPSTSSITYGLDADCAEGSSVMPYYDPHLYVIPLELASASVDIDLTIPAVGTVSVDGLAPTLETSVEPTVGAVGAVTAAGVAPTLEADFEAATGAVGTVTAAGVAPALETSVEPTVGDVGAVTAAGLDPAIEYDSVLSITSAGDVSIAALTPVLDAESGSELTITSAGVVSVSGLLPTMAMASAEAEIVLRLSATAEITHRPVASEQIKIRLKTSRAST